ncbi:GTP-binding protein BRASSINAZOLE INSENSITIVE PALE GREEN 2, chloroplastic [Amborella trichopoda]|uniref:Uncharacterized protein n=1 Tax=Amborella trichopoda TaxID=13333 RepID=U5DBC2_AMBTC|nr:GTP-binding protein BRASSINAZOLE INSENSITIVE PALE GREEN 2, chloroplastic [Amborella trichopoda]ERN19824.1 hypothetical protein AMTR_s00064p00187430 [Amborella trichopoda]|eukprot:XP_006858357.1 GTP-binding protein BRASSINAZOLE INSENSITIVE PALE GREEN 2, chloroplastic [Amborella trichopoda]
MRLHLVRSAPSRLFHAFHSLSKPSSSSSSSSLLTFLSHYPLPPKPTHSFLPILLQLDKTFSVLVHKDPTINGAKEPEPKIPNLSKYRSEGDYNDSGLVVCPGCGVYMQDENPKLPGFFMRPTKKEPPIHLFVSEEEIHGRRSIQPVSEMGITPHFNGGETQELKGKKDCNNLEKPFCSALVKGTESKEPEEEKHSKRTEKPIVCARCHSLRHYGRVKDAAVENLLPDFDFDHTIGPRLTSFSGSRSVVLMVVDASDFDGSFPRKVAKLVSSAIDDGSTAWKEGKSGNVPRVVLVVTKIDLLPPTLSPTRLEHWVRQRAREGGANKLSSVHLVSAIKDWGLKNLVDDIRDLAGARGNVWAIGAQNAGKSTLINSIGRHVMGKITHLTEAPVPGTTLGVIRIKGILGRAKLFDTPGLLHPYQITTRLTREEQKLVHISKDLKPRTYRLKSGYSVHIAGLMRLDVEETSVDTIYLTVWASPYLPLHMGRVENASNMLESHFGSQLQPPIGENRIQELGKWVRKDFTITGSSWEVSSMDVAAAGLGWFAVGFKGEAHLAVWTYEGVDVILRNALIPERACIFETTGFTVSKIVSRADKASNKQRGSL